MTNQFVSITIVENPKYKVLFMNILAAQPTPIQWEMFKGTLTISLNTLKESNKKFAFLLDIRKLGLLGITKIREFIAILVQFEDFIESNTLCSTVIIEARAVKIICGLFLTFYTTRKPLHFFKSKELCVAKIEEYYNSSNIVENGVDYDELNAIGES